MLGKEKSQNFEMLSMDILHRPLHLCKLSKKPMWVTVQTSVFWVQLVWNNPSIACLGDLKLTINANNGPNNHPLGKQKVMHLDCETRIFIPHIILPQCVDKTVEIILYLKQWGKCKGLNDNFEST